MPCCPVCSSELEDDGILTAGLWCWVCLAVYLLDTEGLLHGPYDALALTEAP